GPGPPAPGEQRGCGDHPQSIPSPGDMATGSVVWGRLGRWAPPRRPSAPGHTTPWCGSALAPCHRSSCSPGSPHSSVTSCPTTAPGGCWPTPPPGSTPVWCPSVSKHRCTCASSRLRSSTPTSTSSTSWRARIPVARLSAATGGDLSRSTRHHTLYAPNGYGDELRAVLRTGAVVWGHVCLSRSEDGPAFGAAEADVVHRLSGHVAHGLRVGHLLTAAASDDAGPGVVVLDDAAQVMSATEQGRELLAPVPTGGLELPLAVYEVAQQARAVAEGGGPRAAAGRAAARPRRTVARPARLPAGRGSQRRRRRAGPALRAGAGRRRRPRSDAPRA